MSDKRKTSCYIETWDEDNETKIRDRFQSLEAAMVWCKERGIKDKEIEFDDVSMKPLVVMYDPNIKRLLPEALVTYREVDVNEVVEAIKKWEAKKGESEIKGSSCGGLGLGLYRRISEKSRIFFG
jgi:hypothetical protein